MSPKSFGLVCLYDCSISFLNFQAFLPYTLIWSYNFFQHLGWKPYIKVIYLYFLFVMLRIYFRASHILVKALSLKASPKTIFFSSVPLYRFNLVIFFLDHVKECYLFTENKSFFIQYIQITVSPSLISFQILPTIQLRASFLPLFRKQTGNKKLIRTEF